jgi:hypothetical protein
LHLPYVSRQAFIDNSMPIEIEVSEWTTISLKKQYIKKWF